MNAKSFLWMVRPWRDFDMPPTAGSVEELLVANERKVNHFNARIALVLAAYTVFSEILVACQYVHSNKKIGLVIYGIAFLSLVFAAAVVIIPRKQVRHARLILIIAILLACTLIATYSIYGIWAILMIPVLITGSYLDAAFTKKIAVLSYLCLLGGNLMAASLAYRGGYYDVNMLNLKVPIVMAGGESIAKELVDAGYVTWRMVAETQLSSMAGIAFLMILPVIFAISYADNGRCLFESAMELAKQQERARQNKRELEEVETKVIISQIQPHFLYNTLSAIMAIEGNPDETIDALEDFSRYLRENLSTVSTVGCISIAQEMEHVKRYVKLEQLRFGEKLKVRYTLSDMNFTVPPLTIQMLAENAIKHGITRKRYGGTLWIITEETDTEHIVRIIDDGIGFDPDNPPEDGKDHIGLENVRFRIHRLSHGRLEISSAPGVGTTCTLHLPKEGE